MLVAFAILTTSSAKNQIPDSVKLTEKIKVNQINELKRSTFPSLIIRMVGLLSWTKTFPVIEIKLKNTYENIITIVLIVAFVCMIAINLYIERRLEKQGVMN